MITVLLSPHSSSSSFQAGNALKTHSIWQTIGHDPHAPEAAPDTSASAPGVNTFEAQKGLDRVNAPFTFSLFVDLWLGL
tara:strand:- start:174 stop:410 length:237 start_codon:yes stop_codon:yes gene_type:complete